MSSQGFGKNSGPGAGAGAAAGAGLPKSQALFPPSHSLSPSPPSWSIGSSPKFEDHPSPASTPFNPIHNPGTAILANNSHIQDLKRTRSPPSLSTDEEQLRNSTNVIRRSSVSPPRLISRPTSRSDPRSHAWSPPFTNANKIELSGTNSSDIPVPKRSRLLFTPLTDPLFDGNNSSGPDDTERELQAKAKRMARFREELSESEPVDTGNRIQKAQQRDQSVVERRKSIGETSDMAGFLRSSNLSSDYEEQDSSPVITGYCPDMCPEQERAERERKGDLDQYERMDGNRNQSSESLAVKKYTRTAEREASLIRPMPILQKTMDYLLNLLDQPYDDRFLGLYNFLWDRMRAIRMDLRMQHIFNLDAITMLERMIRLHIIAMHELCRYTKGEGFSEGFDAHLNIEQMNKTSVELFQLYDDHRKKGTNVPTEKEFRGYYALLKLDKHPGYKVEPAELSLDLAKMTPKLRQAAEVLFARRVARACRAGNFIAFFRLVRKASYLQACLMHAHFGKLRTQALASLHSGLQNNQGIPVTQVAKWLGMEEENIEDLLEYHGFYIKEFEEAYMVKEGPFLNGHSEYPLKCSKLVHMKKSTTVSADVLSSSLMEPSPPEDLKGSQVDMASVEEVSPVIYKETQTSAKAIDNDMADCEAVSYAKDDLQEQPMSSTLVADGWTEVHRHMEVASPSPRNIFETNSSFGSPKLITASVGKPSYDKQFRNSLEKHGQSDIYSMPPQVKPRNFVVESLPDLQMDSSFEDSMVRPDFVEDLEPEEPTNMIQGVGEEVDTTYIDEEVAKAKLKLFLRLWRRRSLIKKDLRVKKQLAAKSALSSLSLGPPMRQYKEQLRTPGDFNLDWAMRERYEKQERSWSTLNISDVVAAELGERNQYPRCICWKLIFCSLGKLELGSEVSHLDPGQWLRSKLMPVNISNNDDLLVSLPGISIWKKWDYGKSTSHRICYLSVVKEIQFDNPPEETVSGASAVIFLVSESISLEAQKIRLHNIVSSIPSGSCLPLLILCGSYDKCSDPSSIVKSLGLNEVDKLRICSFSVLSLVTNKQMKCVDRFFSDEHLRKGLEWLASESPLQPVVHSVKTRELVLTHLKFSLDVLGRFDAFKVSSEHCISAINEALDESIKEIGDAAKSNPVCWPCPEISLLSELSEEHQLTELYFPSIGWSSVSRVEPLIHALSSCKLPSMPKDISWWCMGIDIEKKRIELEDLLVKYLTPLMGLALAQKEALTMLQTCVALELQGPSYYMVPKWVMIFQRVFNWQLMSVCGSGALATVYILEEQYQQHNASLGKQLYESYNLKSPSLDEIVEVCCSPNLAIFPRMVSRRDEDRNFEEDGERPEANGDDGVIDTANELVVVSKSGDGNDRLSRLLEQCNIVQNIIDNKLSIYF